MSSGGAHRRPFGKGTLAAGLAIAAVAAAFIAYRITSSSGTRPVAAGSTSAVASTPPPSPTRSPSPEPSPSAEPSVERPEIVQKPIPFDRQRKDEMAAYAERHYGISSYELRDPQVIVEHFTDGETFSSAWNTFASNAVHLGELPGTCSHFIIDKDGTIYQLVPLSVMCRHAVGLNYTAFGIEMVGTSDQEIFDTPAELNAALQLTVWLMDRFHIDVGNVIGHNENRNSPFHMEAYPSWQCQTHLDWNHADMQVFRRTVADLAERSGVRIGSPYEAVPSGC